MSDILSAATACLTACTQPEPRQRRARKGTFAGSLWSVNVPVSKSTVQRVLKYATDKERFIYEGNWGTLVGLRATDEGLVVTVSCEVQGRSVNASLTVGYANDLERQLFTGEWVAVKHGEVRLFPTQLLPTVTATSFGAVVSIKAAVRRRTPWLLRWLKGEWITVELQGLRVTPTWGEVLTGSAGLDFVTPRLNWTEPPVEVESKL